MSVISTSAQAHWTPLSGSTQSSSVDHLSLEQVQIAIWNMIVKLPVDQQCTVLSNVFDQFLKESTCLKHVPDGFIQLAFNGMSHLKKCGRSNVIYSLVVTRNNET